MVEARGSLELFLGYCYFPKCLYKSDPAGPLVAAAYSAVHWGHALVSFVVVIEKESVSNRKQGRRANRKTPVVPLCPNLSQGDTLTS